VLYLGPLALDTLSIGTVFRASLVFEGKARVMPLNVMIKHPLKRMLGANLYVIVGAIKCSTQVGSGPRKFIPDKFFSG
jgi:hypothetical protein